MNKIEELQTQITAQVETLCELQKQAVMELATAQAVGEQLGVEVSNFRGARELQWLVDRFGREVVFDAAACLPGGRVSYPSNIARALRIKLPRELASPAGAELEAPKALLMLQRLRARLRTEGVHP
ncbi:MAG: hypothetical protein ABI702_06155 [Burkholderiales bacterium]